MDDTLLVMMMMMMMTLHKGTNHGQVSTPIFFLHSTLDIYIVGFYCCCHCCVQAGSYIFTPHPPNLLSSHLPLLLPRNKNTVARKGVFLLQTNRYPHGNIDMTCNKNGASWPLGTAAQE